MAHALIRDPRSFVATVVAVAPRELSEETADVLRSLCQKASVRTILVTPGDDPQPELERGEDSTVISGLLPRYLNNAVASLRLSSLPTVAWWRGGDAAVLPDLATLVDRLVLDAADPAPGWAAAARLTDRTAVSDLRWTRLTRWRGLMAQFFDLPDVRAAAGTFSQLDIEASDPHAGRLLGTWLSGRLPNGRALTTNVSSRDAAHPVQAVSLRGDTHQLRLRLLETGTCVETGIIRAEHADVTRLVPLGDQSLAALLSEELRVRSKDTAFEEALMKVAE